MTNRITADEKDSLLRVNCFLPQSSGDLVILLPPREGLKRFRKVGGPENRRRERGPFL